jgi:hypothetical protein
VASARQGLALSILDATMAVVIAGSFIWLAAVGLFLVNLARITFVGSPTVIVAPAE